MGVLYLLETEKELAYDSMLVVAAQVEIESKV